jgi:tetratricopeptide (TPR) repeat protein
MDENRVLEDAVRLMFRAGELETQGRKDEALQMMDKAIAKVESIQQPTFFFRIRRELIKLGTSPDLSSLIPILKEAVDYYTATEDVLELVGALLNLSGILYDSGDISQALNYLDQADAVIERWQAEQPAKSNIRRERGVPIGTLLEFRKAEIDRRRSLFKK